MEKIEKVKLIAKHWRCSDKNVYKLMVSPTFQKKMRVLELGCICAEHDVTPEELSHILKFIRESKVVYGR
jgi:hypothetical protein